MAAVVETRELLALDGLGVAFRPELAMHIERRKDLSFIEILAENHFLDKAPEPAILQLRRRGVKVVLHSIGLSLGGAELPSKAYMNELNRVAEMYEACLISDHLAFVRSGGFESGHLLPVKRTEETLKVIIENISYAAEFLRLPLALENIASYIEWPGNTMSEVEFFRAVFESVDCSMLLDVSNLLANAFNLGISAADYLKRLPLERVAYIHVAGGQVRAGLYHDTHAHPINGNVIETLGLALETGVSPAVLLERDDHFPDEEGLDRELSQVGKIVRKFTRANLLVR